MTENKLLETKSDVEEAVILNNGQPAQSGDGENSNDETKNINGETVNTSTGEIIDNAKEEKDPKKKTEMELRSEDFCLKYADKKFLYEVMSIPTLSSYEYRMVTYIMLWARKRGIDYKFDSYGNIYLTKGEISDGEYYPCVTAHLDTVQSKHKAFVLAGAELDVRTRINKENKHELYVDGIGIGADDKGAIFIGLSMIDKIDVIKGAFFLEEETGMKGSNQMNTRFFDNVGYVIGFDSPDNNRSAWKCSGTKLFTADFYKNHMKPVCDKYGYTRFYSEPFTDIKNIVEKTGIMCMNFCNGGYEAHNQTSEYIVAEETDNALGMGLELVSTIGNTLHKMESEWVKNDVTGVLSRKSGIDDDEYLSSLGDNTRYSGSYSYYGGSGANGGSTHSPSNSNITYVNRTDGNVNKKNDDNSIDNETIQYIVDTYDERLMSIENGIKKKCEELGIDFDSSFKEVFSKEIKF